MLVPQLDGKQKKYLESAIPWGILNPDLRWLTTAEMQCWQGISESLTVAGLVAERELAFTEKKPPRGRRKKEKAAQQVIRPVLTVRGMEALVEMLDEDNPLRALDCNHITLRNGKNASAVKRMVITADLQAFLSACGVDNVYSAVVDHGENPFVFGPPDRILNREKQKTFMDRTLYLLADHVERHQNTMPLCSETGNILLYLPNVANAKSVVHCGLGRSKNVIAATNNTGGLVLDFKGRRAYVALCHMGDKPAEWPLRAHIHYQYGFWEEFRKWDFQNMEWKKDIKEALLFLRSEKELIREIRNEKFQSTLTWIIPVMMNEDGAVFLRKLLQYGIKEYNKMLDREAVQKIKGAELLHPDHQALTRRIIINGQIACNGMLLDLKVLRSLVGSVGFGTCPLVICYKDQVALYHKVIGVPEEKLVVVERS